MAQQPLPMEEWWRPIPRTPTTETYVTGAAALNIPHGELCAGWHGLMWHMRIAGDGDAIERANRARMGRADKWPYWDETSLRDTRKGLAEIGPPGGKAHGANLGDNIRESGGGMGPWKWPTREAKHGHIRNREKYGLGWRRTSRRTNSESCSEKP